ncbi:hypothetical protein BSZ19_06300 [Bradyrhizobium japonicum]|uniref:Uncharacterized protein n=1 Tax=Bradyrhizobium japonicum TaxID=375 RepID=A0A1Y2JV95_BRAJP|nr:hypothetical protein BSZ19_06300 [Bradyrhizobium japonicum]
MTVRALVLSAAARQQLPRPRVLSRIVSARTLNRDPAAATFLAILMGGTLGMLNAFGAVERTRRRRSTQIEEINRSERDSEQAGSPCV